MAKYKNSTVERLKALKIKESKFFLSFKTIYVHDSMSHAGWLSDQFCIYKLKLRFLKRGSRITDKIIPPRWSWELLDGRRIYYLSKCIRQKCPWGKILERLKKPRTAFCHHFRHYFVTRRSGEGGGWFQL